MQVSRVKWSWIDKEAGHSLIRKEGGPTCETDGQSLWYNHTLLAKHVEIPRRWKQVAIYTDKTGCPGREKEERELRALCHLIGFTCVSESTLGQNERTTQCQDP